MSRARSLRGFTLIELLVAMAIMAILGGLLLAALAGARGVTNAGTTKSLIFRLGLVIEQYKQAEGCLPPDTIPAGAVLVPFQAGGAPAPAPDALVPPEALYYYLANPFLSPGHPLAQLSRRQQADHDGDGFPEIVDAWGRPLLYNRPRFATGAFDNGTDPVHRTSSYDLISLGRDGQTGSTPLPDPGVDLPGFCAGAMDEPEDGSGEDDIRN